MTTPPFSRSLMFAFSAAGFMATRTFGASPGVRISSEAKWIWKADTPWRVPAGARISAGKSGSVARSFPSIAVALVNRSPVNCMPSPESPANRTTTRCFSTTVFWTNLAPKRRLSNPARWLSIYCTAPPVTSAAAFRLLRPRPSGRLAAPGPDWTRCPLGDLVKSADHGPERHFIPARDLSAIRRGRGRHPRPRTGKELPGRRGAGLRCRPGGLPPHPAGGGTRLLLGRAAAVAGHLPAARGDVPGHGRPHPRSVVRQQLVLPCSGGHRRAGALIFRAQADGRRSGHP